MGEERLSKKLLFGELVKKRETVSSNKGVEYNLTCTPMELEVGGTVLQGKDLCGASPATKALKVSIRRPNRVDRSSDHLCPCGRSFR